MKSLLRSTALFLGVLGAPSADAAPPKPSRPNVLVIVADDMGYSDMGAFGGEIRTPNLDQLARAGVRLTDFHAAPTCSPTRSMLLSGTDNHTAGVGAMAEMKMIDKDAPATWGYEGVITRRVATLAERLRDAGYFTAMAGKWHLGLAPDVDPHARGFQASFALLQGAHNHFGGGFGPESNPGLRATYTEDGRPASIPPNFYSSDYFTTKLLSQLAGRPKGRPFFAYLAFTAPHSPLQAPPEDIARYRGRYDAGWAALREERLARMKSLGIIARNTMPAPFDRSVEAWSRLTPEQKQVEARKMEIYASMVDRMDQNVGRLIAQLKKDGEFRNTVILFTSDNGPAAEGAELYGKAPGMADYLASRDSSYEAMGTKASTLFYGPNWALAASAPYRLHKNIVTEGGTRVAAFITFAGFRRQRDVGRAFATVMDVTPTILDAARVEQARVVGGRDVEPIRGKSMVSYLSGSSNQVHAKSEAISFELHGQRTVRQGEWKLVWLPRPAGTGSWSLYDLASDPAEQRDLSRRFPKLAKNLADAWEAFAVETRIVTSGGAAR